MSAATWDDQRVELFEQLRRAGKSMRECGEALGCSKNATTGIAFRLAQKGHPFFVLGDGGVPKPLKAPKITRSERRRIAKEKARAAGTYVPPRRQVARVDDLPLFAVVPAGRTDSILDLRRDQSRYVGEDGLFCGSMTEPGRGYCPACSKIVYLPLKRAA